MKKNKKSQKSKIRVQPSDTASQVMEKLIKPLAKFGITATIDDSPAVGSFFILEKLNNGGEALITNSPDGGFWNNVRSITITP